MTEHDELDERLARHFSQERAGDARRSPPFAEMLARARSAVMAEGAMAGVTAAHPATIPPGARPIPRARRHWRWALVATPLAVAAGIAAVLLSPSRSADREFERTVAEWSRVERAITLPTDGLLSVPGSEYLRRLPALGAGAGASRRPM
jgi:anti-sigma factor RsiW